MGIGSEGLWLPHALNECFKFGRYTAGCHFSPHIDGPWVLRKTKKQKKQGVSFLSHLLYQVPEADICSIYTVVIYLNDADSPISFQGGSTNFLSPPPSIPPVSPSSTISASHMERSKSVRHIERCVVPKTGSALVFKHEMWHESAQLIAGTKYILRTELLFKRVLSPLSLNRFPLASTNPLERAAAQQLQSAREATEQKLIELYERSEALYARGQSEGFVETYLSALHIQSQVVGGRYYGDTGDFPCADTVADVIWCLDTVPALCTVMEVNRLFYRLARLSPLWRQLCLALNDSSDSTSGFNNSDWLSKDWFGQWLSKKHPTCETKVLSGKDTIEDHTDQADGDTPEVWTVVLDMGSYQSRAGIAGDAKPKGSVFSVVGRKRHCHVMSTNSVCLGTEALMKRGILTLKMPIKQGYVINWDDFEHVCGIITQQCFLFNRYS